MPTLSFEGESHDEIVRKVRRWLASVDGESAGLSVVEAVQQASEVTKDALALIAQSAPGPIRRSDLMKALIEMGHDATDATRRAVVTGLESVDEATDGAVRRAEGTRNAAVYEMNKAVARQVLKALGR